MTKSWNTVFIITKVEDGVEYLLLVKARSTNPQFASQGEIWKFPGGGNEPGDLDFLDTGSREVSAETGLVLHDKMKARRLCKIPVDDHLKIFYLVPFDCFRGTLRKLPIRDGEDELSPPQWFRRDSVPGYLYRNRYHQDALLEVDKVRPPLRKTS